MKKRNIGFTLIELLVVIVIIGILATLSTATFSGYIEKANDVKRQSFIAGMKNIVIGSAITANGEVDYTFGVNSYAELENKVNTILIDSGVEIPPQINGGYKYGYFTNSKIGPLPTDSYQVSASDFVVVTCKESGIGKYTVPSGDSPSDLATDIEIKSIAFTFGTLSEGFITKSDLSLMCHANPIMGSSLTNWDFLIFD